MEVNVIELLLEDPELRALAQFGIKRGVNFAYYLTEYPVYSWYFDPDPSIITVPVSKHFKRILPFHEDGDEWMRKIRFAHELGHAIDFQGVCPNSACFSARYKDDWCMVEERRAWLHGLRILQEVCAISEESKEKYLQYAFWKLKTQSKHCIRFLRLNPATILQDP
jgi:hypothetical protein